MWASPPDLLLSGGGRGTGLRRLLRLDPALTAGVLHVSVQAAACDGDPTTGEVPEHAACRLGEQDWGIPVEITRVGTRLWCTRCGPADPIGPFATCSRVLASRVGPGHGLGV